MEPGLALLAVLVLGVVALLPIASFVVLLVLSGKVSGLESELKYKLSRLEELLRDLKRQSSASPEAQKAAPEAASSPVKEPAPVAAAPAAQLEPNAEPAIAPPPVVKEPEISKPLKSVFVEFDGQGRLKASPLVEEQTAKASETVAVAPSEAPKAEAPKQAPPPPPLHEESQPSDFERNAADAIRKIWNWLLVGEEREGVSLEYAVATTWLTRGAIIIILASVAFGINYSIKNGLIGPYGRVAMSFAAGLFMTCWGLYLAKGKYRPAAQGLMGGGLAALYFSSFASSMIYHLIEPVYAFGLMGLVTAGCCVLAISVDSLLIALIGTLGGYLTPVLLSTGDKNLPGLFAYMAMLGVGLLFVARKRDWKLLNALSLLFTYGLYFAALWKFYDKALDYPVAVGFGAAFFLIFSLSPLLYNLTHKRVSTALELILMLLNSVAFFVAAHMLTVALHPVEYASIVSLSLAAYNILFAFLIARNGSEDKALFCMLYAFASFFVAFTVPLLLGAQWIGAAWSLQALCMLWLAKRLGGKFLPFLAYLLYCVAGARLLFFELPGDFSSMDKAKYLAEIPERLGSFGSFIGSLAGAWLLLRNGKAGEAPKASQDEESLSIPSFFMIVSIVALLVYLHFELHSLAVALMPELNAPLLSAIWTVALLVSLYQWLKSGSKIAFGFSLLFGAGLMAKLFLFDLAAFGFSERLVFDGSILEMRALDFLPAIGALFAGFAIFRSKGPSSNAGLFATGFLIALFSYLTLEIKTLTQLYAIGFSSGAVSVFWGVFALGMLFAGIRRKTAALRLAGLILFLVTGVKIFMLDLASLSQLARIAAFFALGVATLAGAFIYMRFRSVFEDSEPEKDGSKP